MKKYTVGIDFGTLSARAVLLDTNTGTEISSFSTDYPHAVMDKTFLDSTPLPRGFALQHPADYLYALENSVKKLLEQSGTDADDVAALGFDFTASTVLPIDKDYNPLCFDKRFENEPHAYVKLWKHNSAAEEADKFTSVAALRKEKWLSRMGGKVSPEWLFPKVLETLNNAPEVYDNAYRFVEAADFITMTLSSREVCSASFAGFKSLWSDKDGYPSKDCFNAVKCGFGDTVLNKLPKKLYGIMSKGITLSKKGAQLTGLKEGIPLSIPQLDAHASMPGAGVTDSGALMLILGTSAVQLLLSDEELSVDGICGYHRDSVVQGKITYESGQICFGDHFDWFVKNCVPASYTQKANELGISVHTYLTDLASAQKIGQHGLVALDWFNGNRSVLSDSNLSGLIIGLNLTTAPEDIYRAIIEANAFGCRVIIDNYQSGGIPVNKIIASGGIALKNPLLMQIMADVLNRPISVSESTQSAALGSAIYAACACDIFPDIHTACKVCSAPIYKTYFPQPENVKEYDSLFKKYLYLHDLFGRQNPDFMKNLRK